MKFDIWQPSWLVDVLIKCYCCNCSGTWFVGIILVIAVKLQYVIVIYWSLFGSVKICNPYRSVQIATEKYFIILTKMRLLSSFKPFYYPFDIAVGFLLRFGVCQFYSNLHISAKICKTSADLYRFAKIENLGISALIGECFKATSVLRIFDRNCSLSLRSLRHFVKKEQKYIIHCSAGG